MDDVNISWTDALKNRQLLGKYTSLINSIAIASLACLVLIYVVGGVFDFLEGVFISVFGYTIIVDFIYLLFNCILHFLMCWIPVKLFNGMHAGTYNETHMPVEKKIINKETLVPIFLLGLSVGYLAYFLNLAGISAFLDYSGKSEEYLWRVGLRDNYQIFFYIVNVAVIPAVSEELLCRKAFCDALAPYGQKTAILVSSIVFSLLHANFVMILHTFVTGLIAAWLYVGTKNIKLSMSLHFVFNLLAAIGVLIEYRISYDAFIGYSIFRAMISLIVAVVCFIYLFQKRKYDLKVIATKAELEGRYEEYLAEKKKYKHQIEMLPGENGEEIIPIKKKEKIKEFFSPLMILFIVCTLIISIVKFIQ